MSKKVANQEMQRIRQPVTFSRERAVAGELHLLRARLDALLGDLAGLIAEEDRDDAWLRVEEAARLGRRALSAAVGAVPPLPLAPNPGELLVGGLRVDPVARRQWYGEREFELTPLHHQLLAVLAADPFRVFAKDELSRAVWRRDAGGTNAVNTSVSRLRRALVAAGAPQGRFMLSVHGVGWPRTTARTDGRDLRGLHRRPATPPLLPADVEGGQARAALGATLARPGRDRRLGADALGMRALLRPVARAGRGLDGARRARL